MKDMENALREFIRSSRRFVKLKKRNRREDTEEEEEDEDEIMSGNGRNNFKGMMYDG